MEMCVVAEMFQSKNDLFAPNVLTWLMLKTGFDMCHVLASKHDIVVLNFCQSSSWKSVESLNLTSSAQGKYWTLLKL